MQEQFAESSCPKGQSDSVQSKTKSSNFNKLQVSYILSQSAPVKLRGQMQTFNEPSPSPDPEPICVVMQVPPFWQLHVLSACPTMHRYKTNAVAAR